PLTGMALSAVGAIIGLVMRTPEEVGAVSTLLTFVLVGFGPVLVPPDRLPGIIEEISLISPATYAASALRQTLLGMPDRIPVGIDLVVLAAVLVGSLWIVGLKMDWRQS
ncbi:MAG: ABC transporter permease, partial [Chloroflexi bacterium]